MCLMKPLRRVNAYILRAILRQSIVYIDDRALHLSGTALLTYDGQKSSNFVEDAPTRALVDLGLASSLCELTISRDQDDFDGLNDTVRAFPNVCTLRLRNDRHVADDNGILWLHDFSVTYWTVLSKNFPNVYHLDIAKCEMTHESVAAMIRSDMMKTVQVLTIEQHTRYFEADVSKLLAENPKALGSLHTLHVVGGTSSRHGFYSPIVRECLAQRNINHVAMHGVDLSSDHEITGLFGTPNIRTGVVKTLLLTNVDETSRTSFGSFLLAHSCPFLAAFDCVHGVPFSLSRSFLFRSRKI